MATFNTTFPIPSAALAFTARSIQNSGASSGIQYIFISPADFANGATFNFNVSVSANGNGGGRSELVSARLYALNGAGIADTAAPLSSITNTTCTPAFFPVGGVAEIALTLTSAITIGTRYALRIFPNTNLNSTITFNVTYSAGHPYIGAVDEYHVNGVTLSTGYPNLAIGTASSWYTPKCTRTTAVLTTVTSVATSQVGFRFSLSSGSNYTLKNIRINGLVLSSAGTTTGSYTGRILDSAGTTTLVSTRSVLHANIRAATSLASNFKFEFISDITLTGGTTYFFVVESGLGKQLQYLHFQEDTDTSQTFSGEVNSVDVVSRNGTSGAFTSFSTLGPPAYRAVPVAEIEAIPVASAGGSGMVVHPGMMGGIRG